MAGTTRNSTRYTLNFSILEENKGTAGVRTHLLEIFVQMQEFCSECHILPWNDEKDLDPIKSPDKIPETITLLQIFFPGVRPVDGGGMNFSKINLSFPITTDRVTFERDISSWGTSRQIRFYKCPVQHANVKTACWLPYLPRSTNFTLVSELITASYAKTMKENVPIGIFWRALNGQREIPNKNRVRAVHVECPHDKTSSVKKICGCALIKRNTLAALVFEL